MGNDKRFGPGDSVYQGRLAGEATDDDVEGHSMKLSASRGLAESDEDDTEGHKMGQVSAGRGLAESDDDDTEGHRQHVS